MDQEDEIPCVTCKSWNGKRKKFSCNPKGCIDISAWLPLHIPQLSTETTHKQVQLQEIAIQYIV
jgi:hypothetical protein